MWQLYQNNQTTFHITFLIVTHFTVFAYMRILLGFRERWGEPIFWPMFAQRSGFWPKDRL